MLANKKEYDIRVRSLPEPLRCEEVEQVEKLLQVVLQRSSSQQQLVLQRVVVQHPEKLQNKEQHVYNSFSHTG